MTSSLIAFFVFWGVWLFVPLLIDGATAISYLAGGIWMNRSRYRTRRRYALTRYPKISLIIPVYNGEKIIGACVDSIGRQTYPLDRVEVIVVDNLSADRTVAILREAQQSAFPGVLKYFSVPFKGKSWALNAGIYRASGEIVCNLDADVTLHPDALMSVAQAFEHDPSLAAITGAIEVGELPEEERQDFLRYIIGECEFLEYYAGFRIGRQYQSLTNSLFTLAGAFSGFRREVLAQTPMYQSQTVSEDTHLTFEIHRRFSGMRIQCLPDAIAYVAPAASLRSLYAQRVRWQRGELEVASLFSEYLRVPKTLRGLSLPRALIVDHTLAFPRVIWTFLMPMLYFLGYPLEVVVSATLSMYLAYMGVDGVYAAVTYYLAEESARARLRRNWWIFMVLPVFRWTTFWFRFGGFLTALMDPPEWQTNDPIKQTIHGLNQVKVATIVILTHLSRLQIRLLLMELFRIFRS